MSNLKLKPCPFCGGEARLDHDGINEGMYSISIVQCLECGARTTRYRVSTAYASDEYAINAWNRRENDNV